MMRAHVALPLEDAEESRELDGAKEVGELEMTVV